MKYLAICAIWIFAYFAPMAAGDWYDVYFNLYQAAISAVLIYAILALSSDRWAHHLCALCAIQIIFNIGDIWFNRPPEDYNYMLGILNSLEAFVLFGVGGLTQLYRMRQNGNGNRSGNPPSSTLQASQGAQGK